MVSHPVRRSVVSDPRLLQLVGDTADLLEVDEFGEGCCTRCTEPCRPDWVSLNDIGPDPDTIWGIVEPPLTITAEQQQAFSRYAYQNPLIERISRTHDGRAVRFSDVIDREELHAREIYNEYYALVGVEHQIAFTLLTTRTASSASRSAACPATPTSRTPSVICSTRLGPT